MNINLKEKYDMISTPLELLEFMSTYFSYGYLGKDGKIYRPNDVNFNRDWHLCYQLQSLEDILNTKTGNCFDMVELERTWFCQHGYQIKTFFTMVALEYANPYPMHSFLVYFQDNHWYLFEFSDSFHRGIFKFSSLDNLLNFQHEAYLSNLGEKISEKEIKQIIVQEFCQPSSHISADEYLNFVLNRAMEE